ncbi:M56 family metallopeptidase [Aestuariibaculum sp. M13]|uniref:M56 family metallopeptidase n=1 Tax=Aestuariibaculum sp. M13 TaxID=2967132 RepID=UPI00215A0551|nr:M56 family metallopeptidase [Aestuariibaculum sp. M13]MCR8666870.1 M56 family metallopeptidase [Aestuariibaculum sp. M13]
MIHYVIQTIAFQLFFLLIYDVFLKRETFFSWNRLYLIATAILSILLPFVKLESFKGVIPQEYVIQLPAVIIGDLPNGVVQGANQVNASEVLNPIYYLYLLFYVGFTIAIIAFGFKLFKILKLIKNSPKANSDRFVIVKLLNSNSAFSFFKYVFLGEFLKDDEKALILSHEEVHVKQYHSLDLLFFEVLRVVFWFNPLVYMYQNRITELHEYLADAEAVKNQSKQHYYQNLLAQVFQTKSISFINPFFNQSLIKKRIIMLQKSRSKHIKLLKYAFLIPAVITMLVYTSCEVQKLASDEDLDLSQYTYTFHINGGNLEEDLAAQRRHDEFIKANRDKYVSWGELDATNLNATFTVHSIGEQVPDDYEKISKVDSDGIAYFYYTNFFGKDKPLAKAKDDSVLRLIVKDLKNLTEEEKEQRARMTKLLYSEEKYKKLVITDGQVSLEFTDNLERNSQNELIEVPFGVVDEVPLFPGCESLETNEERKNCMSFAITKFVGQNFNTDLANSLGLEGKQRINVIFKINEEGNVVDVRSRAPHPALEEEAKRVIQLLPQMQPGRQKGKVVMVPYSLPIIFQVADKK